MSVCLEDASPRYVVEYVQPKMQSEILKPVLEIRRVRSKEEQVPQGAR